MRSCGVPSAPAGDLVAEVIVTDDRIVPAAVWPVGIVGLIIDQVLDLRSTIA